MNIKRIIYYYNLQMKKHPWLHAAVFLSYGLATIGSNVIHVIIIKQIIDLISLGGEPETIASKLFFYVFLLGILAITYNIFYRIGDYTTGYFQSRVLEKLANFSFDRIHNHSYKFFTNHFVGSLVTKTKRFIRSFETIHDKFLYAVYFGLIQLVATFIVLFWFAPLIATFFIGWLILYCLIIVYFVRRQYPLDLDEANADSNVIAKYADTITNALTMKMFSSKKRELHDFRKTTKEEERIRIKAWNYHHFQSLVQGALFSLLEITILYMSIKGWIEGSISTGTIVLIQIYVIQSFGVVWNIGRTITELAKALSDAQEFVEILDQKRDIQDPKDPEDIRISKGHVVFKDVSFAYSKNHNKVFEQFNLTIPAGQKIGLVGHSGAGKTTITKLLLRFSDIQKGTITIDGQDITHVTQDDLRGKIAYVPQEPLLFHRTLRENISYANPEASDEEILEASKKAHAHEFIEKLPKKYDTLVGERGIKLSGGERQRIAIARAMLKNAPILILDEATSSLDSVSEHHIQEALKELMEGKTTLVIAHRLSTVQSMDRIVVIEDGTILEDGTHEELRAKKGQYAAFWDQQSGGFLGK